MASLRLFSYEYTKSPIHQLHALTKLFYFVLLSWLIFSLSLSELPYLALALFFVLIASRLALLTFFKKAGFLVYLGAFAMFFGSLQTSPALHVSLERLAVQSLFVFRLLLSFVSSEILLSTTRISEINDILTIFLKRIPFVRRLDFGLYLAVTVRFIPQVFSEYEKISAALQIRGGKALKNPVRKAALLFTCLISNMLRKAIGTAYALEVKQTNWQRTIILQALCFRDRILIAAGLFFLVFMLVF